MPAVRLHTVSVENLRHGERWIDPSAIVEGVFKLTLQPPFTIPLGTLAHLDSSAGELTVEPGIS